LWLEAGEGRLEEGGGRGAKENENEDDKDEEKKKRKKMERKSGYRMWVLGKRESEGEREVWWINGDGRKTR